MVLFGRKPLPVTSYGYQPPPEATAKGWVCTNSDCGVSEHEPVKRWPKACNSCGSSTDPLFNQPWEHDAEGIELQWILHNDPKRGGGFHQDRWEVWQFRDAALRGDNAGMSRARVRVRSYAADRMARDSWWGPGDVFFFFVWIGLQVDDLNGAADDLCHWLSLSSSEDVENDNTNRTNCRQVIDSAARFLAAPGGGTHPRAPEIRQGCVKLAEGAYQVLNRDQQNAVTIMARA
jgi:hypothetical protein